MCVVGQTIQSVQLDRLESLSYDARQAEGLLHDIGDE